MVKCPQEFDSSHHLPIFLLNPNQTGKNTFLETTVLSKPLRVRSLSTGSISYFNPILTLIY